MEEENERRQLRDMIRREFDYEGMGQGVEEIREWYRFDVTCQGTVPQALVCALEATGFEDAIRNAISIGGDSDTVAAIAGGVAEAIRPVPKRMAEKAWGMLTPELQAVLTRFSKEAASRSNGWVPPSVGREPDQGMGKDAEEALEALRDIADDQPVGTGEEIRGAASTLEEALGEQRTQLLKALEWLEEGQRDSRSREHGAWDFIRETRAQLDEGAGTKPA